MANPAVSKRARQLAQRQQHEPKAEFRAPPSRKGAKRSKPAMLLRSRFSRLHEPDDSIADKKIVRQEQGFTPRRLSPAVKRWPERLTPGAAW
jgi:hypothetical protein